MTNPHNNEYLLDVTPVSFDLRKDYFKKTNLLSLTLKIHTYLSCPDN